MTEDNTITILEDLFNKLDKSNSGVINLSDLNDEVAAKGFDPSNENCVAKRLMERVDANSNGEITFDEFLHFAHTRVERLRHVFNRLDRNKDGKLDREELKDALDKSGFRLSEKEILSLIEKMSDGNSLEISWEDWRDYLILSPSIELPDVVLFWRHATYLDMGEDISVPDDFTSKEFDSGAWWRHLVAGGVAGAVSRTSTAPLDRIKVFLQVHSSKKTPLSIKSCLQHLLREGGVPSLWRGNGMNVLKIAPESALKFMAYEYGKRFLKRNSKEKELRMSERFLAGSFAGAFSQSLIYPMEVIKTRLALRKTGEFASIVHMIKTMYLNEGYRVFYRGYVPNLLGILPYAGIDLAIYETLKKFYTKRYSEPNTLILLSCGTISSSCGQIASYPLALVRTKLQADTQRRDQRMLWIFKEIVRSEGLRGLYRGILPNFLKVAPAVSISYAVYEHVRQSLGVQMT